MVILKCLGMSAGHLRLQEPGQAVQHASNLYSCLLCSMHSGCVTKAKTLRDQKLGLKLMGRTLGYENKMPEIPLRGTG